MIDAEKQKVYTGLRMMSGHSGNIAGYATPSEGYGDATWGSDPKPLGIGEIGFSAASLPIEDFIPVSNLLTTKSNVFKITILAQTYDRKFNVAAERKLEAIVDRGYVIDDNASSYSAEAKERAKQVKVLSYRWVTEEE